MTSSLNRQLVKSFPGAPVPSGQVPWVLGPWTAEGEQALLCARLCEPRGHWGQQQRRQMSGAVPCRMLAEQFTALCL